MACGQSHHQALAEFEFCLPWVSLGSFLGHFAFWSVGGLLQASWSFPGGLLGW